jgi:probable rRNA maturation factor
MATTRKPASAPVKAPAQVPVPQADRAGTREPWVLYEHRASELKRRELAAYAEQLGREVAGGRRFTCLITNDAALHLLNREFRGKDAPTDVLSFPAGEAGGEPGPEIGDIAISIDRARAQARERGHDTATEVRVLLLHGVLHLMGYDHERDGGRMRRLETRWRAKLGLPAGLIERAGSAHR